MTYLVTTLSAFAAGVAFPSIWHSMISAIGASRETLAELATMDGAA